MIDHAGRDDAQDDKMQTIVKLSDDDSGDDAVVFVKRQAEVDDHIPNQAQ